jgi:BirA family biotin operon repressor/biotin-[acetyl-CoA-carboxylase] ligase
VSLKQITGKDFNSVELAKELCSYINNRWQRLVEEGFSDILKDYNKGLYKAGEQVIFTQNGERFEAIVRSVNKTGQLLINDGKDFISFGEVEWVLS